MKRENPKQEAWEQMLQNHPEQDWIWIQLQGGLGLGC